MIRKHYQLPKIMQKKIFQKKLYHTFKDPPNSSREVVHDFSLLIDWDSMKLNEKKNFWL